MGKVETVSPGEIGEIIIRGPVIMREYWNNPEATAETVRDEWLYTGDLARVDEEGYFYIVDRAKDMIVSGGLNTYPAEVENVIYSFPKVSQAAVIGLPHKVWGEMVAAVVRAETGRNDRRGGTESLLQREPGRLQVPEGGHLCGRPADERSRKGPEEVSQREICGPIRTLPDGQSTKRAALPLLGSRLYQATDFFASLY